MTTEHVMKYSLERVTAEGTKPALYQIRGLNPGQRKYAKVDDLGSPAYYTRKKYLKPLAFNEARELVFRWLNDRGYEAIDTIVDVGRGLTILLPKTPIQVSAEKLSNVTADLHTNTKDATDATKRLGAASGKLPKESIPNTSWQVLSNWVYGIIVLLIIGLVLLYAHHVNF